MEIEREEMDIGEENRERREVYWRRKKREKKGILEEEIEREEMDIEGENRRRRDGY